MHGDCRRAAHSVLRYASVLTFRMNSRSLFDIVASASRCRAAIAQNCQVKLELEIYEICSINKLCSESPRGSRTVTCAAHKARFWRLLRFPAPATHPRARTLLLQGWQPKGREDRPRLAGGTAQPSRELPSRHRNAPEWEAGAAGVRSVSRLAVTDLSVPRTGTAAPSSLWARQRRPGHLLQGRASSLQPRSSARARVTG